MKRAAVLLLAALASCRRPVLEVTPARTQLLANGYDQTEISIRGLRSTPVIKHSGERVTTRLRETGRGEWRLTLRAGVMPGVIKLGISGEGQRREQRIELTAQTSDSGADGTPDYARLESEPDREDFRTWLTSLAEIQYLTRPEDRPLEIKDCSSLVRYCYREALRDHNPGWVHDARLRFVPARGSVQKYSFPHTLLGARIFRVRGGTYSSNDLSDGTFSEFADARTLRQCNMFFISRDVKRGQPGDILFYRRETKNGVSYHSMIFAGGSRVSPDSGNFVVYHTGPEGANEGDIRRLTLDQLLRFPDPEWRPIAANSLFLGVYRWNILKALS